MERLRGFRQREAVGGSLGKLAMTIKGIGSGRDLVRCSELVVGIVELVDRLVMAICEYRGLGGV